MIVIYQFIHQVYINSQSMINTFTTRTILQLCKNKLQKNPDVDRKNPERKQSHAPVRQKSKLQ